MDKIYTYLLGAGASFNTLPLINDFGERLAKYKNKILNDKFVGSQFLPHHNINIDKGEVKREYIEDLIGLIKQVNDHYSIDTYARKLFLTDSLAEYKLLKLLVSEFLIHEELINGVDKRYDAFFAAILDSIDGKIKLPENIRVLSWNYDKQIEFSMGQFFNSNKSKDVEEFIQLYPRENYSEYKDGFSVFKLNGSIGGTINGSDFTPMSFELDKIKHSINSEVYDKIVTNTLIRYIKAKNDYQDDFSETPDSSYSINYSWENERVVIDTRNYAKKAIQNTDTLVIIGYSFPTFNRKVDKEILSSMKKLGKIYVQSPKNSVEGVIQRVKALLGIQIDVEPISNVEEFHIPFSF